MAGTTVRQHIAENDLYSADLERKGLPGDTDVFFVYVYDMDDRLVKMLPLGRLDTTIVDTDEIVERGVNLFNETFGG